MYCFRSRSYGSWIMTKCFKLACFGFCALVGSATIASADVFSNYEDLTEGFKGATFTHNGVTYRDVNNVSGFYADGSPFGPTDNGDQSIIERAVDRKSVV